MRMVSLGLRPLPSKSALLYVAAEQSLADLWQDEEWTAPLGCIDGFSPAEGLSLNAPCVSLTHLHRLSGCRWTGRAGHAL